VVSCTPRAHIALAPRLCSSTLKDQSIYPPYTLLLTPSYVPYACISTPYLHSGWGLAASEARCRKGARFLVMLCGWFQGFLGWSSAVVARE
jgi:hypothetical protein